MNYLKIVNSVAMVLIFAGFMLMLGAVGTCDYMDAVGEYYPATMGLPHMIGGLVMLGAGAVITNWLDRNFNYYEEQEGDEE